MAPAAVVPYTISTNNFTSIIMKSMKRSPQPHRADRVTACLIWGLLLLAWASPAVADKTTLGKLNRPVTIDDPITSKGSSLTLKDALDAISGQSGLKINIDWPALERSGIEPTRDVPTALKGVAAQRVLHLVLEHASADTFDNDRADYAIVKGGIKVTTRGKAQAMTTAATYSLKKYLSKIRDVDAKQDFVDLFIETIQITTGEPDEWLDERSIIQHNQGKLAIKTTARNHAEIANLFDQLGDPIQKVSDLESKNDRAAQAALDKNMKIEAGEFALFQIINKVRETSKANVAVNWLSLELVGLDYHALVKLEDGRMSSHQLLDQAFKSLNVDAAGDGDKGGYMLHDGLVLVATQRELAVQTELKVYKLSRWMGKKASDFDAVDQLTDTIMAKVGNPDEWRDEDSTLTNLHGLLIVNTTPSNHRELVKLLDKLRR